MSSCCNHHGDSEEKNKVFSDKAAENNGFEQTDGWKLVSNDISTEPSPPKILQRISKTRILSATACFLAAAIIIVFSFFNLSLDFRFKPYTARLLGLSESPEGREMARFEKEVLPAEGVILPVRWGDLGSQLIKTGVINVDKFESIYEDRGGLDEGGRQLLYGTDNGELKITKENAGLILNLLWALGLGNKNDVLEKGPMSDKKYGGAEKFASTGGWTLAKGNTMSHYSKHKFLSLTPEQQRLVEETSWNIYRSCCNNPTYFPDCNHGMAMLGFLELMASQNVNEADMYKAALAVNSYWFPDTYINLAKYFDSIGTPWKKVDPKEVLGADYSSASGYRNILNKIKPVERQSGGSCGV